MTVDHRVLFNFSASPVGGGLKRLCEYARWFHERGGAWFLVHPACERLKKEFGRNEYFVLRQSRMLRVLGAFRSVRNLARGLGDLRCYYSYGIPIYERVAPLNWFHVSNVLPLAWSRIPMSMADRLKFALLGRQITRHLHHADIISAESRASLDLIDPSFRDRLFLSVNGSDDELRHLESGGPLEPEALAVAVGTYRHKALEDAFAVFDALRARDEALELRIFGAERWIPRALHGLPGVVLMGERPRGEVIDTLRRARYYLSTTRIENSYNAASEGIFFAEQSYLSDIGPHRELLEGMPYDVIAVAGVTRPLLHVERHNLSGSMLRSWNDVVSEMIARIDLALDPVPPDVAEHV
jgi:hypothetical protein